MIEVEEVAEGPDPDLVTETPEDVQEVVVTEIEEEGQDLEIVTPDVDQEVETETLEEIEEDQTLEIETKAMVLTEEEDPQVVAPLQRE